MKKGLIKVLTLSTFASVAFVATGCGSRSEEEIWETAKVSFGIQHTVAEDNKLIPGTRQVKITGDLVCLSWLNDEFKDNGGSLEWIAVETGTNNVSEYILVDETHSGQVERPSKFEGDQEVSVIATLKMGSRSETRQWDFVVAADDWKTSQARNFYELLSVFSSGSTSITSLEQLQQICAEDSENIASLYNIITGSMKDAYDSFIALPESANKTIDMKSLQGQDENGNPAYDDDNNPVPNYIALYTSFYDYLVNAYNNL